MRDKVNSDTFAERLGSSRRQAKMSFRELAEKSGVSFVYLHELEKGQKNPSVKVVQKIANALGVAPAWLINADWEASIKPGEIPKELIPSNCILRLPASWVAEILNEAIRAGIVRRVDDDSRDGSTSGVKGGADDK